MDELFDMIDQFEGGDRKKAVDIALKAIQVYIENVVNCEKNI